MDEYVSQILKDWNLSVLQNIFRFHSIDKSRFSSLTENEIHEIIPEEFGTKIMCDFKKNYKLYLMKNFSHEMENDSNLKSSVNSSSTSFSDSNETAQQIVEVRNVLKVLNNSNSVVNIQKNIENEDNNLHGEHLVTFLLDENESFEIENIENEVPCSMSNIEKFMIVEKSYSQIEKNMPLFKLLSETLLGRFILYEYSTSKTFSRKDLSKIVIQEEMKKTLTTNNPFSMSSFKFKELSNDIKALFPTEEKDLFYDPSNTINDNNKRKRVNSSGYLYVTYLTFREKAAKSNLIDCSKRVKRKNSQESEIEEVEEFPLDLRILCEENPANESVAVTTWKYSFYHRTESFFKKKSAEDVLDHFKILNGGLCKTLISSDFEDIFKNYKTDKNDKYKNILLKDRLLLNWSTIAQKIIKVAKNTSTENKTKKKKNTFHLKNSSVLEDEHVKHIDTNYMNVDDILEKNKNPQNDEHKNSLGALLLPCLIKHIFKSPNSKNPNSHNSTWKPEEHDIVKSFIVHIEVPENREDLQTFVDQKFHFYESKEVLTVQPYIIICGELSSIKECYVVLGKVLHKFKTIVEAIDFCFKSFYALHIDYPIACPHIWSFFQKYVYEIKGYKPLAASKQIFHLCTEIGKIVE